MTSNEDLARGKRLKILRERLGLSQNATAAGAGVDRTNLSRLENGRLKFTSPDVQLRLANQYGVEVGDLVSYAVDEISIDELLLRRAGNERTPPDPTRVGRAEPPTRTTIVGPSQHAVMELALQMFRERKPQVDPMVIERARTLLPDFRGAPSVTEAFAAVVRAVDQVQEMTLAADRLLGALPSAEQVAKLEQLDRAPAIPIRGSKKR